MSEPRFQKKRKDGMGEFIGTIPDGSPGIFYDIWEVDHSNYQIVDSSGNAGLWNLENIKIYSERKMEWAMEILKLIAKRRDPSVSPNA